MLAFRDRGARGKVGTGWLSSRPGSASPLQPGRQAWVQAVRGIAELGGSELREGAGVAVSEAAAIRPTSRTSAELLLLDLA